MVNVPVLYQVLKQTALSITEVTKNRSPNSIYTNGNRARREKLAYTCKLAVLIWIKHKLCKVSLRVRKRAVTECA